MSATPRPSPAARIADAWGRILRNPSALIVANTATQSLLRMASNVVLARLLAPSAFALLAITTLILTGIQMISDVGIAITALREGEMSREDESKLWTMQLVRGLGVALLMIVAAVPIGWLYQDDRLRDVLFALALMPALQGAQSLYPVFALARRRLLPSTLLEIGGRVGGIILSILVAFVSPTVWSLVVGTLAGVVVSTVGGHLLAGYRPRFVFDRAYIARQWRFARWIQTSSTLYFLGGQVDKALFPFLFGLTALGLYGIGATFAAIPTQVTQRWSASVFYPLAVQFLRGDEQARARLFAVRTTMLLYSAIMALAVAAISPVFFLLLYEPQYHAAARFAQILAIAVFFETAESSLRHFPLVEGVPQFEVWSVAVRLAGFGIGVLAVLATHAGMVGYALAYVFGGVVAHAFMLAVCVRRGYLGTGVDLPLTIALAIAATVICLLPVPRATPLALVGEGVVIGLVTAAAMLLVYVRRGLPSLSAEPAPEMLREAAEEELGERTAPV